jgi:mannose-6-phosphate isomerase-like protein (cupin superfamily)
MIEPFIPHELGPKQWGTELLIAETPTYIGKVLWMQAGHMGAFQYHERKDETFYLFSGKALIRYKMDDGIVCEVPMVAGESYHVPPGSPHQVEAQTDCVFFEASTPHFDDRVPA